MKKLLRRPRLRTAAVATVLAGGLVLANATPALADYNSPLYPTLSACNAARPTYYSSYTVPQACYPMYNWNGTQVVGYMFLVKTRY